MRNSLDTICAQATAIGEGGIAILRLSGPRARDIAKTLFFPYAKRAAWKPRYLYLGEIREGDRLLDCALCAYFRAPYSYTG